MSDHADQSAAPALISMFIAPFAGRLADRTGGKAILFVGLSLFSLGMGILIASSHVGSSTPCGSRCGR